MSWYSSSAFNGDASFATAMDYLINTTNALHITTTENNNLITKTNNPCLDLFIHIQQRSSLSHQFLTQLLQQSWTHNPLTTLKVMFYYRRIERGPTKENFITSTLWLYANHPKTLAFNVEKLAELGYLKYLVEIVYRIIHRSKEDLIRERAKELELELKLKVKGKVKGKAIKKADNKDVVMKDRLKVRVLEQNKKNIKRVADNNNIKAKIIKEKEKVKERRMQRKEIRSVRDERYYRDENYKFLNDEISGLFAKLLKSDMMYLKSGETNKITLAAKWLCAYDKSAVFKTNIGVKFHPRHEYQGVEEEYVKKVDHYLVNYVILPLCQALKSPEVYKSAHLVSATYQENFIDPHKIISNESDMEAAISGKWYQQLVVYD